MSIETGLLAPLQGAIHPADETPGFTRGYLPAAPSGLLSHLVPCRIDSFGHSKSMTTVLSDQGQIALPGALIEQLRLSAGDDLEVFVVDDDTITLRKVSHPPNRGLTDLLMACPAVFEVPERERDSSLPLSL